MKLLSCPTIPKRAFPSRQAEEYAGKRPARPAAQPASCRRPCHVPPRDMRQHPIGTGLFKFVGFKPNEYIKVTRNPDYWKKGPTGLPYFPVPPRANA